LPRQYSAICPLDGPPLAVASALTRSLFGRSALTGASPSKYPLPTFQFASDHAVPLLEKSSENPLVQ